MEHKHDQWLSYFPNESQRQRQRQAKIAWLFWASETACTTVMGHHRHMILKFDELNIKLNQAKPKQTSRHEKTNEHRHSKANTRQLRFNAIFWGNVTASNKITDKPQKSTNGKNNQTASHKTQHTVGPTGTNPNRMNSLKEQNNMYHDYGTDPNKTNNKTAPLLLTKKQWKKSREWQLKGNKRQVHAYFERAKWHAKWLWGNSRALFRYENPAKTKGAMRKTIFKRAKSDKPQREGKYQRTKQLTN